ncbi:MAG: glycosyltransferase family 4 protein [Desulfobacterales bacterium]
MIDRSTPLAKNIGFVSTRFAGTDGVSLEACKWARMFEEMGCRCFWFAGDSDRESAKSRIVPEAHFQHEKNRWINEQVLGSTRRTPLVTRTIHELRSLLKAQLHRFIEQFQIDLIIAENVLTIPMNVPLGLALTEVLAETQIPGISHNHDFYWERVRYAVNAVGDYLRMAFPPNLPNLRHVVINSEAQEQLALRAGIASTIIPNVLDFEHGPAEVPLAGSHAFRESNGLSADDRLILQPTRVIRRKGIEHAIALVKALDDPLNKLLVSHEAGDEGLEYGRWLKEFASDNRVDLRFVQQRISAPWTKRDRHRCPYTLWDVYPHADFITYPSLCEGFGNAFLEAVFFRKPVLINRYSTFVRDIEPLGFDLIVMDGYLTRDVVSRVQAVLEDADRREAMVRRNYAVAARHFAYGVLRDQFDMLLKPFFGPKSAVSGIPQTPPSEKPRPAGPDDRPFHGEPPEPLAAAGA